MRFRAISPSGKTYILENGLEEFCENHDLCIDDMLAVAEGKIKDHKGWKCTRLGE